MARTYEEPKTIARVWEPKDFTFDSPVHSRRYAKQLFWDRRYRWPWPEPDPSPEVMASLKRHIYHRDRVCLRCCATTGLTIDHIVPRVYGGRCTVENLQLLCWRCNEWKGCRVIDFRFQRYQVAWWRERGTACPVTAKIRRSEKMIRKKQGAKH